MRLLSLALAAVAVAVAGAQKLSLEDDPKRENTYFDGKRVPPLLELTPKNWDQEINQTRFLMVKHYSPYCPHCIDFAPLYQTMYEFYFTSKPNIEKAEDTSFMKFYDFRFGMINCVAYQDLCSAHNVASFPLTIIYEEGAPRESIRGVKGLEIMATAIEDALDTYKPGTRPKYLDLPSPGDKETPKDVQSDKSFKIPTLEDKVKPAPLKTAMPLNPSGSSIALNPESFQKLVTVTKDPWFIKFYAPWCPHCQSLAPTWDQLGKSMKDKLNIGEVNCEAEKRLCKEVGVGAFPTLLFFSGGERIEYIGLRGIGDLTTYSDKALELAGGIPDVDAKTFSQLEKVHDVIFVYLYDEATVTEDFDALNKLPLSLIGHGRIVKTKDRALADKFKVTTFPRLMVSRDGRPDFYEPLSPMEMRDVHQVLTWMETVWLPMVPEITANNAKQVMNDRLVVLAVLDRSKKTAFEKSIQEIKSATHEWKDRAESAFKLDRQKLRDSKQARIDEAKSKGDERGEKHAKEIVIDMESRRPKEVGFAWIDGTFWQRWLKTTYGIDVKNGEQIVINDQERRRYWDTTPTGGNILVSRTAILDTLDKIAADGPSSIPAKYTISAFEKIFWDIRFSFVDRPLLSLCVVAALGFGFVHWLRNRRHRRGGHFRVEEGLGIKEGFLGSSGNSNSNSKAD